MTETTTLPIPPDTLLILAAFFGLVVFSYVIFLILPDDRDPRRGNPLTRVNDSLGFRVESKLTAAFLFLLMMIYFAIFAFAAVIALRALGAILFLPLPEVTTSSQNRTGLAFGTLLAAILGAPLIVWRSWVARKTAAIAEESLFNDKINAAATDLAAQRQVTQLVKDKDGNQTILTEWEDDLVTRAAAIDRLEGLAKEAMERDDYAPAQRIARMLSIYVQELSRQNPSQELPENSSEPQLSAWLNRLGPIRTDMERAVQSLGGINLDDEIAIDVFGPNNIDLRNCNLQGFDLEKQNLRGADFFNSTLHGANLIAAKLQAADLFSTDLRGADLEDAQIQGAAIIKTRLSEHTDLNGVDLRGAAVWAADHKSLSMLAAHSKGALLFKRKRPTDWLGDWVEIDANFSYNDLVTQWRAWAATLDPPVTIAPDYRP